jgi:hypothetical protein
MVLKQETLKEFLWKENLKGCRKKERNTRCKGWKRDEHAKKEATPLTQNAKEVVT